MPTVRTTMQPTLDLEVGDREAEALRNQGLLVDSDTSPAAVGQVVDAEEAQQEQVKEEDTKDGEKPSSTSSGKRSGSSK
jgi:hypothetical protein